MGGASFVAPKDRSRWPLRLIISDIEIYPTVPAYPTASADVASVGMATEIEPGVIATPGFTSADGKPLLLSFVTRDGENILWLRNKLNQVLYLLVLLVVFLPTTRLKHYMASARALKCVKQCMRCLCCKGGPRLAKRML